MSVLDSFSLSGKVALVTGGAGRYGKQIVEALAEAGAETYLASRNLQAQQEFADELAERGLKVYPLELDLSDEASISAVVSQIISEKKRLDILVNNAVTRSACSGWDLSMDDFDKSLRINASALFFLTRLAAEEMKKHGTGSIINIGSYMGTLGPNPSNYEGTTGMFSRNMSPIYFFEKGGMVNFTRFAASILGIYGIRVNCINPGGFQESTHQDKFIRQYSNNTMLGRLANDTDLKGIIVFLASEASQYLTACNIPVDGGYIAK